MTDRFNTIAGWVLFCRHRRPRPLEPQRARFPRPTSPNGPRQLGYRDRRRRRGSAAPAKCGAELARCWPRPTRPGARRSSPSAQSCHTIDAGRRQRHRPESLRHVGEPIGEGKAGFAFSSALSGHGGNWTYENLDAWLNSPQGFRRRHQDELCRPVQARGPRQRDRLSQLDGGWTCRCRPHACSRRTPRAMPPRRADRRFGRPAARSGQCHGCRRAGAAPDTVTPRKPIRIGRGLFASRAP